MDLDHLSTWSRLIFSRVLWKTPGHLGFLLKEKTKPKKQLILPEQLCTVSKENYGTGTACVTLLQEDLIRYTLVRGKIKCSPSNKHLEKGILDVSSRVSFCCKYRVMPGTPLLVITEVINSGYRIGSGANYRWKVSIKWIKIHKQTLLKELSIYF